MGMEIFFQPFFFSSLQERIEFLCGHVIVSDAIWFISSILSLALLPYFIFLFFLFISYHVWVIWYFTQRLIIAVWCMNGSYYWYPLMDHGYSWYLLRSKFKMLDGSTCINHAVDILKFFHTSVDLVNLGQWGSLMFEISNLWDWGNTWLFSWCVNHSIGALFKWIHLVLIYPLQGGLCEILFTLHLVMHWALFTH